MAEFVAEKREILGSKTETLRKGGLIPAELYGHDIENVHLSISKDAFSEAYKEAGEHAIVNVIVDGESRPVLIHDVQVDPVSDGILSVDLYQVNMNEKVTTHVPIEFVGESPAVRDMDGVLIKVMDELEIEALPANIPQSIEIDLSVLTGLDQSIYVRDIKHGDSYEIIAEPESVIASVSEQREEEVEPVGEELTPEDVIVEGEEKRAKEKGEEADESSNETGGENKET